MSHQLIERLQHEVRELQQQRLQDNDTIASLEKALSKHDVRETALSVEQEKRNLAEDRMIAAEKAREAATRKLRGAESKIRGLEAQVEELEADLAVAREQAGKLAGLDALIAGARHSGDLFSA